MYKYIIADDHDIYRDGLNLLLSRQGFVNLGEAENGEELLRLTISLKPDLVVTDILMPVMDGIAATKAIKEKLPGIKVIALSMHQEESLVVEMLEAGAQGYLLKNADKIDLLDAIDAVMQGGSWFCHNSSGHLTRMIASSRFEFVSKKNNLHFTHREREIMKLVCRQLSSREIAEALNLSTRTIEGLRASIQEKMGVKNTVGMVVFALQKGLISEADMKDE
ncbi:MAG: response regulator transcription factor [Chitinophagaceae bacterium]|nr:response regulator transcription factor [Chitinophagaceae bacterium]